MSESVSSEPLIRVNSVSKKFCRSLKRSLWYGVRDIVGELNPLSREDARRTELDLDQGIDDPRAHSNLRKGEFWAVNGVSFELRRGECLGLLGQNGAGKTTLLKMLNGLIKPDAGTIEMRGRVAALIALGTGFNPILTGRENILVNGSVLGLRKKEIEEKLDDIIDFAEIRDFIDTPVQSYSSGMQVRLGFAVATALKPDILLLDEVLAVGDLRFTLKCLNRMSEILQDAAVIFVSHNLEYISRICTRVLVMANGRVACDASHPSAGIDFYHRNCSGSRERRIVLETGASLLDIRLGASEVTESEACPVIENGGKLIVDLNLKLTDRVRRLGIRVLIHATAGRELADVPSFINGEHLNVDAGTHNFRVRISPVQLNAGMYWISIAAIDLESQCLLHRAENVARFQVNHCVTSWAPVVINGQWEHSANEAA